MAELFPNLAKQIKKEKLEKIGNDAVEGYKNDKSSRYEWETRYANWQKLFTGQRDPKSSPWQNCSNVCIPAMSIACIQFQARAFEALIPPKNIVKAYPIGKEAEDMQIAERISRHMDYQLMFKMEEFEESMDVSLMQLPIQGSVFRKTYYDPLKGRNVSDYISPADFVVNYKTRRLEDCYRYTHRIYMPLNEIKIKGKAGIYINTKDLDSGTEKEQGEIENQADKSQAMTQLTNEDIVEYREILEQHTYLDLDGDGIKEPYVVIVDLDTAKVLRITSRINPATGKKMEYFTHYIFIPNPDGFYGIGFGMLLEHINESINTSVNQLTDAGSLANTIAGFIAKRSGIKRGDVAFKMGQFKEVDLRVDDIRKAVHEFRFNPPSDVLLRMLTILQDYANRVTTVTEMFTGEMPRSDTPATTIMALIEQGMKVFSAIHKRVHRAFKKELKKIYDLNGIYLDEVEYFNIVVNKDEIAAQSEALGIPPEQIIQAVQYEINRSDYLRPLDVRPVSDPNIISRAEKLMKSQMVYETVLNNPYVAQNPEPVLLALREYLKAMDINEAVIDQLVQPPPPPPDLPPEKENEAFINEQDVQALPGQNHEEHLQVMADFEQSPFGEALTPNGRKLFEKHRRQHIAYKYREVAGKAREINQAAGYVA